jgi:ethanolamine utilization microcompartment shell protein EutL
LDSSIQAALSSAHVSGQLLISNSRNTQISALTLNGSRMAVGMPTCL